MAEHNTAASDKQTEHYFSARTAQADVNKAIKILKRACKGGPFLPGDEVDG